MAGNMIHLSGLLLVLVMMSVGSWGDDDPDCDDLATKAMLKCNSRIKHVYYEETLKDDYDVIDVYCKGMRKLLNCSRGEVSNFYSVCSKSDRENLVMEEWFFVVMQYLLMSRRLDICDWDITKLKNLYTAQGFENKYKYRIRSVFRVAPTGEEKVIAKRIHVNCIPQLVEDPVRTEGKQDLCQGVKNFVECYQTGVAKVGQQAPLISTRFAKLILNFSIRLVEKYEMDAEQMCFVQRSALDEDD